MTAVNTAGSGQERAAQDYAARDWYVVPTAGKLPHKLAPRGSKSGSTDPDVIRSWWRTDPDANVAIVCRPSGMLALDVDDRHGGVDALHELERRIGVLPITPRSLTGDGLHVFVANPRLRTPASVGSGIDVRDRHYVVAPPSLHESGRRYEWEIHPDEAPVAELPDPWRELLTCRPRNLLYRQEGVIPNGRRNDTLTRKAGAMRRAGFDAQEIHAALVMVNAKRCQSPLPESEVGRIAESIGKRPMAPPWALDPIGFVAGLGLPLSFVERFVLAALCHRAKDDGLVIGGRWIDRETGLERKAVERALRSLLVWGVLLDTGRLGRTNVYRIVDLGEFADRVRHVNGS